MKIFHIIRTQSSISLFKEIVQECIHSGIGDTAYISSGFFQEAPTGTYCVSSDLDSLSRSFISNTNKLNLHFRGVYSNAWIGKFGDFLTALYNTGVYTIYVNGITYNPITPPVPIPTKNHAKVFLYEKIGVPLLAIIGSSNFTSRAYGTIKNFNTEADLVICNCNAIETRIYKKAAGSIGQGVMILNYDEANKIPIEEEMKWIRDQLF